MNQFNLSLKMSDQGSESQGPETKIEPETDPDPNLHQPTYTQIESQENTSPESQPTYTPILSQESPPPEPEIEPESQPEPGNAGDDAKVGGDEATGESTEVEEKKEEVSRTLTMRELLDELKTEEQSEDLASATPHRSFLETFINLLYTCVSIYMFVCRFGFVVVVLD